MFRFSNDHSPPSKSYVTHGVLPDYIDLKSPPIKKKPFSAISNQPFTHTVDLILPEDLYDLIWEDVQNKVGNVQYSKVIMPPLALLEGGFFNVYTKSGNVLMLSEGRPGIDNIYFLKDGVLRLELPKEVYERAGLVGKPIPDGGRKHIKTRYAIEINLRLPSMLHGRKGFERIVWAFENVLNHAVTWLFYDFNETGHSSDTKTDPLPINKYHPIVKTCETRKTRIDSVLVPDMKHVLLSELSPSAEFEEEATDLHEWLGLVALGSSRIKDNDIIDPYLCRYSVPGSEQATATHLVKLSWQGLLPVSWIRHLFLECTLSMKLQPHSWFAITCYAFQTKVVDKRDGFTILRMPSNKPSAHIEEASVETTKAQNKHAEATEYLLWEMSS